ncbi:hypothetical protein JVU11DRAFT_12150 [Chiua virens]|nr:hypothetical protein JVU11DRAFT_12150 [Chiua virens]
MSDTFSIFAAPIETPEEAATRQEFQEALDTLRAQAMSMPDDGDHLEEDHAIWSVEWPKRFNRLTAVMATPVARGLRLQVPSGDGPMLSDAHRTCQRWLCEQEEARARVQKEREEKEAVDRQQKEQEEREREEENARQVAERVRKETQEREEREAGASGDDKLEQDADPDKNNAMEVSEPTSSKDEGTPCAQTPVVRKPRPRMRVVVEIPPRKRKRVPSVEPTTDEDDEDDNDLRRVGTDRCARCIQRHQAVCTIEAGHTACIFCSRRRQGCSHVARAGKVTDGTRATTSTQNTSGSVTISTIRSAPTPDVTDVSDAGGSDAPRLRSRKSLPPHAAVMRSEVDRWLLDVEAARSNHQAAVAQARQAELHLQAVERGALRPNAVG